MIGVGIPRVIHQTWKDSDVPSKWRGWVESWRRHHPQWRYQLWTDEACRNLIAEYYDWFLPVYDGYQDTISRVDAFRYFLLDHVGGVYVDLDFECLRPVTDLVGGEDVVFGLEPDLHAASLIARERGFERVVGNAFIASPSRHPFWAHAHRELVATHDLPDPMDVAGPYFLTRAVQRAGDEGISVLPAELLYPKVNPYAEQLLGPRKPKLDGAYAVHHWSGSWSRDPSWTPRPSSHTKLSMRVSEAGRPLFGAVMDLDAQRRLWRDGAPTPTVSCLMAIKDRMSRADRAIACFRAQTYPDLELVVVDDSPNDALRGAVATLDDTRVRYRWLPGDGRTLGELRTLAVGLATGPYVCQWNDDDLCDPERIELQMAAILAAGADACFIARHRLWRPAQRRLALSRVRLWESSLVARKDALPRYPAQRRGEDAPVVAAALVGNRRIVSLDAPLAHTYVYHDANTLAGKHVTRHFDAPTQVWTGPAYIQQLLSMAARLPIDAAEIPVGDPAGRRSGTGPHIDEPSPTPTADRPSVLILTPMKDAASRLDSYVAGLLALDYPLDMLSVGVLECDSTDDTWARLLERQEELAGTLGRVTITRRDFGLRTPPDHWDPDIQLRRRGTPAKARNHLLSRALADEDWVLWLDADVASVPPDLVQRLLGARKEIVAAHCVTEPAGPTFDLNTFVLQRGAARLNWSQWLRDGLLQPPKGFGRIYLDELRAHDLIRVDAVGGLALLVRADLHRDGLIFPAFPYAQLIETEGMAAMAHNMGVACWAMPNLEVTHPVPST